MSSKQEKDTILKALNMLVKKFEELDEGSPISKLEAAVATNPTNESIQKHFEAETPEQIEQMMQDWNNSIFSAEDDEFDKNPPIPWKGISRFLPTGWQPRSNQLVCDSCNTPVGETDSNSWELYRARNDETPSLVPGRIRGDKQDALEAVALRMRTDDLDGEKYLQWIQTNSRAEISKILPYTITDEAYIDNLMRVGSVGTDKKFYVCSSKQVGYTEVHIKINKKHIFENGQYRTVRRATRRNLLYMYAAPAKRRCNCQ